MTVWDNLGSLGNVEDRRGMGGAGLGGGGLVGIVLFLALSFMGINIDPALLDQLAGTVGSSSLTQNSSQPSEFEGQDAYEKFTSTVLGSTNEYWSGALQAEGKTYQDPKLVLFRDATRSGCGVATTQIGPHYCPTDSTVYLDETFFDVLRQLGGSNGDVAQAYVIAHEVGHHAQNQLGIMQAVQNSPDYQQTGDNSPSVRLELQADCFAGLWANSLNDKNVFGPGDIDQAIASAKAVGDDRIQQKSGSSVNPESWTHGSSEDRATAFNKGYETGKISVCREYL